MWLLNLCSAACCMLHDTSGYLQYCVFTVPTARSHRTFMLSVVSMSLQNVAKCHGNDTEPGLL
jgi:hypothetical protein